MDTAAAAPPLPDGVGAVVKRDCPTCEMVAPVLRALVDAGVVTSVLSQDDPTFPTDTGAVRVTDDRDLTVSFALDIESVPTLLTWKGGHELLACSAEVIRDAPFPPPPAGVGKIVVPIVFNPRPGTR